MKVRILTNTNTILNENWNVYGDVDASPSQPYVDRIITNESNSHRKKQSLREEFYKDIGIDIVAETVFDYPVPKITEKIFRPIINKKMFIVLGPANTLSYIKSFGLKTFNNFINEDYDNIENPIERFNFVTSEIKRICSLDLQDINKAINDNRDIIEHNFRTLTSIEIEDYKKLDSIFNNL